MEATAWIRNIEELPLEERIALPSHGQEHWYILASRFVGNRSVLEVGAGHGVGLRLLSEYNPGQLAAIDLVPLATGIAQIHLEQLTAASFEFVIAIDVIEHVADDVGFLAHLLRISRMGCFITTPNYDVWKHTNQLHVREYTPSQFSQLLEGLEYLSYTIGKDRILEPMRKIASLDGAMAHFGVLIRNPALPPESAAWQYISQQADGELLITQRLSRLSKWASEWMTEMKAAVADKAYPDNVELLRKWLLTELHATTAVPICQELEKTDPIAVLQRGSSTPAQEAMVLRWALEHVCGLAARRLDVYYPGKEGCQLAVADGLGGIWTIEGFQMQIKEL